MVTEIIGIIGVLLGYTVGYILGTIDRKEIEKMTREDAIAFFKDMNECTYGNLEAVEMAIKALEQEPCDDCVSRKSVNELFDSEIKMYKERIETRKGSNYHDETERIKEFRSRIANAEYWQNKIKALPPVTPTRKKGKWVTKFHGFPPEPYTACSNCDYDIDFEISKLVKADAFTIKPYRPKLCPNCGAEMEGEE